MVSSVAYVFSKRKIVASSQSCLVLQSTFVDSLGTPSLWLTGCDPTPPVSFCAGEEHRGGLRNILAFPGALKQQQQKESILVGPSGRPRPRKCLVGASRVSPRCVLVCGRRCVGPVGQPEAETVVPRQGGRVTLDSPGSTKVGWSVKPRRESPLAVGGRRCVLSLPKRCLFAPEVEAVVRP